MGYSIAAPLKSAKARDACYAFLLEYFRPWSEVVAQDAGLKVDPDYDWTRFLQRDGGLDYDRGKHRVGFNYGVADEFVGEYAYTALRFCALRWGRKRKLEGSVGSAEPVPYIVYDGYQAWPVLPRSKWEDRASKDARWCLVDALGLKLFRRPWIGPWQYKEAPRAVTFDSSRPLPGQVWAVCYQADDALEGLLEVSEGRIASDEPVWLMRVEDAFKAAGETCTVEYGPLVLSGWRKKLAAAEEPLYLRAEALARAEFERLDALAGPVLAPNASIGHHPLSVHT